MRVEELITMIKIGHGLEIILLFSFLKFVFDFGLDIFEFLHFEYFVGGVAVKFGLLPLLLI